MKKSEIYRMAQRMVLAEREMPYDAKLEILRELFSQEDLAKLMEEVEKKNAEANQE